MSDERVVRWGDLVCTACQDEIIGEGWRPKFFGLARGTPACEACLDMLDDQRRRYPGRLAVRRHELGVHTTPSRCLHEAAHAVVGDRVGLNVTGISLGVEDLLVAGGAGEQLGGRVRFGPTKSTTFGAVAVTLFAGWACEVGYLRANGLDDRAQLLDARYGSVYDMASLAGIAPSVTDDVFAHGNAVAPQLIAEHDREIRAVAESLAARRDLDRSGLHAAMSAC